jgi:hypothetical protein
MFTEENISLVLFAAHSGEQFNQYLPYLLIVVALIVGVYLVTALASGGRAEAKSRWSLWEWLVYCATLVSVGILAATSFGGVLSVGALSGWALFAHMVGAGMFVFVLPVLAVTWCEPGSFDLRPHGGRGETGPQRFYWLPKLTFWLLLAAGWVVSMTMLISMLTWLGTDGLEKMLDLHRWSGLVVVAAAALHVTGVLVQRIGKR